MKGGQTEMFVFIYFWHEHLTHLDNSNSFFEFELSKSVVGGDFFSFFFFFLEYLVCNSWNIFAIKL